MCLTVFIGVVLFLSVSAVSATDSASFTPGEIANASVAVENQINTNEKLPDNVKVGNQTVNTAQYLHLAAQATSQIQNNNNTPIQLQNDRIPGYSEESLNTGSMSKSDYVDFAQRINGYMNDNHQAPPYGYIGLGKIGYQSQVYLFSRILSIYNSTGSLPTYVTVKPFTSANIPILYTPPVTFTPQQIATAAVTLQNTIETTKNIPNTITINGITIYTAQFLHLATQATTQLKNNNLNPILLQNDDKPGYSEESLQTGTMTQNDYLDFAQRLTNHMNDNHQAPPYGYIGLGKIGYQSQIYLFTRILSIYNTTGSLPTYITMKPFTSSNIPILYTPPVTFTPQQIATAAVTLQNTIETTKTIPNTITVNGITIYTAQFLHLATQATTQLKNNNHNPILLQNDDKPGYSEESLQTGTMTQNDYLDFAQRLTNHMNDNHQAPPYGYIGLGKIGYQSQIYLFTRILSIYNTTGSLPTYITMKPFTSSNIPILYTPPVTFTPQQIATAAVTLQNTIETTKTIPNTVTVNGITIYTAQFLHLATQATSQLKNNNFNPILLQNDDKPGYSEESLQTGTMTQNDYLDFAQRLTNHMNDNHQAPPYGYIGLGKIGYQSQIYLFTRILSIYNTTGSLPTYITMKPFTSSNIPILYTPPVTFTPQQIATAAVTLQNTIETTKNIPNTITINGITIYTAQFLHLATQATTQLRNNNFDPILLKSDEQPSFSEESLNTGSISVSDYVDFAQRINNHMNDNHQAPPYGYIGLGKIGYQSQIYLFTRILSIYNSTGSLPNFVTVKPWSASNIPIPYTPAVTFTPQQIITAAVSLKNTIENTKTLPSTVVVGTKTVTIAQFLHMAVKATVQLNNNNNDPILFMDSDVAPGSSTEDLVSGVLFKDEYLDLANRINSFMNDNHQAPAYGLVGLGKIGYKSQVYLYCRVLSSYNTNQALPALAVVKVWNSTNIPLMETPKNVFTLAEILAATNVVEDYLETYKHLPSNAEIAGVPINMAQYLHLLTIATVQIRNNINSPIALQKDCFPSYSEEQLSAGNIGIMEYVDFAQRIANHMNDNHQAPPYGLIGLGKISYQSQIYLFNQILNSYSANNALPATAYVKSLAKPVWLTSDRIVDYATDLGRMNAIVNLLRSWGVDANVFYNPETYNGIPKGYVNPDNQNAVLRSSSVQQNALVVDIYGGACAGTIYAMAGSYYQSIIGSREVFTIWTTENGGWDITNLPKIIKDRNGGRNFLPRAHDDTFSPSLPDWGYNYYGVWTDGLNNPDQFLISHGFNFMVCGGDIVQMASAIFNEART